MTDQLREVSDMPEIPNVRRERMIAVHDPQSRVRTASIEDLQRLQIEAEALGLSARWSTREALVRQVDPTVRALVSPIIANGGRVTDPDSFRCYIWFRARDKPSAVVSLLDVQVSSLTELPQVTDLRKVVRVLLDATPLTRLD